MQAIADNPDFLEDKSARAKYCAAIRQGEQQTLQQLYEPKLKGKTMASKDARDPQISAFLKELNVRRRGFQDTGNAVHGSALQEVEQEREVAFEVESVRQIKKPPHHAAYGFPGLHRDIETFARTGYLPADSHACQHFLASLVRTNLGRKFKISRDASASKLYVSMEFGKTINNPSFGPSDDNYIRPVSWILWSQITEIAIVIIPEEAERVIPIIRSAAFSKSGPKTYLLTYAAPITRKMLYFSSLKYYSIPSLPRGWEAPEWLTVELGIFAGRLYFDWREYRAICQFLGVEEAPTTLEDPNGLEDVAQVNGVDDEASVPKRTGAEEMGAKDAAKTKPASLFTSKPLQFMHEWLAVRRRGQDFVPTPMGYITQDKRLDEAHPFFRKFEAEQPGKLHMPVTRRAAREEDEVEEDGVDDNIICASPDDLSDDKADEIEYHDDEMYSSGEDETPKGGTKRKK